MKRMIAILMLVMMSTLALAAGSTNSNGQSTTTGQTATTQAQEQQRIMVQNNIEGLETARLQVRNQEQAKLMETLMQKIQERHRERLNQLEDLVIDMDEDTTVTAEGVGEKRLLGILPMQLRYEYRIQQDGELRYQRQWYDNIFSLPDDVTTEE